MGKRHHGRGFTVGSLLGVPQGRDVEARLPGAPPALRGEGCCRSMCPGCPWAEAVRRGASAQSIQSPR